MMANTISPQKTLPEVPFKVPIQDQSGFINQAWAIFFNQLRNRAGGAIAYTNVELATLQTADIAALQALVTALQSSVASFSSDSLGKGRAL